MSVTRNTYVFAAFLSRFDKSVDSLLLKMKAICHGSFT